MRLVTRGPRVLKLCVFYKCSTASSFAACQEKPSPRTPVLALAGRPGLVPIDPCSRAAQHGHGHRWGVQMLQPTLLVRYFDLRGYQSRCTAFTVIERVSTFSFSCLARAGCVQPCTCTMRDVLDLVPIEQRAARPCILPYTTVITILTSPGVLTSSHPIARTDAPMLFPERALLAPFSSNSIPPLHLSTYPTLSLAHGPKISAPLVIPP